MSGGVPEQRRVRLDLGDGNHMDVCVTPEAAPETIEALRELGKAVLANVGKEALRELTEPPLMRHEFAGDPWGPCSGCSLPAYHPIHKYEAVSP